jgi:uncharacterized protein YecT (DUF1311 family)
MILRKNQGIFSFAVMALASNCITTYAAEPLAFQGAWLVEKVVVDLKDQPHWHYFPDDPRLLGRVLKFDSGVRLEFNFGKNGCDRPEWATRPATTLSALIGKTFPRPQASSPSVRPTLQDFELTEFEQTVTPHVAICRDGTKLSNWGGTPWLASLRASRLLMAYGGDTLLLLRKLSLEQPVAPSFACKGLLNATEKSLCSSHALAGYDRSVAAAYKRSLARRLDERIQLEKEQREWLANRNTCQGDAECLEEKMAERVDWLMQN